MSSSVSHVAISGGKPPLDINLFREEKGGNPELVRQSQRDRNCVDPLEWCEGATDEERKAVQDAQRVKQDAAVALVDGVIARDKEWRAAQYRLERPRHTVAVADDAATRARAAERVRSPRAALARRDVAEHLPEKDGAAPRRPRRLDGILPPEEC